MLVHGATSPEPSSPHVRVTVGAPVAMLYQPVAAGAAGDTAIEIAGAMLSSITLRDVVALGFPARSRM